MKDTPGQAVSAQAETPTSAAQLEIILVAYPADLPGRNGRGRRTPRRASLAWMRLASPPVAVEETLYCAVTALAEMPTAAAELTIVLLPCSSGRPRSGRRSKRGRMSRPWTRPPGAGPP